MEFISKLRVRGILIIASVFLLALTYNTFAKSAPPGLDEVLKKPGASLDWSALVFGFFALSLSTLSLAKVYEIFKKLPESKEEAPSAFNDTEIKLLKGDVFELKSLLKSKTRENEELTNKLGSMLESAKDRAGGVELLKKSIEIMRKDNEKLLAEKEKLRLELSQSNSPDLFPKEEAKPKVMKPRAAQKRSPAKSRGGSRKRVK